MRAPSYGCACHRKAVAGVPDLPTPQPAPPARGGSPRSRRGLRRGSSRPGQWSVRVLVIFLKTLFVRVWVIMAGAVVAVLVLMLHVLVVMKDMSVHVSHIAVLVLVAVWRIGHVPLRPD